MTVTGPVLVRYLADPKIPKDLVFHDNPL